MKLGWGLIGPGLHADLRVLPAIRQSSSAELIGICHYNKEKADFFAQRYGANEAILLSMRCLMILKFRSWT